MTRMRRILLGAGTSLALVLSACGSDSHAGAGSSSAGGSRGSGSPAAAGNVPGGAGGDSGSAAAGVNAPGSGSASAPGAGNLPGGGAGGIACPAGAATPPGRVRGGGPGVVAVKSGTAAICVKETDGLRFVPTSFNVRVGDIVRFTNAGTIAHNVTFPYAGLASTTMKGGNSFLVRFTSPGNYPFICTLHIQGMTGTVTVR